MNKGGAGPFNKTRTGARKSTKGSGGHINRRDEGGNKEPNEEQKGWPGPLEHITRDVRSEFLDVKNPCAKLGTTSKTYM